MNKKPEKSHLKSGFHITVSCKLRSNFHSISNMIFKLDSQNKVWK